MTQVTRRRLVQSGATGVLGAVAAPSLALGWPLLLEMIAMTVALALNPERLGTTRRRKALAKAGRYALTLDFLVRSPDAPAGQRLMNSLTADWQRHNANVIGYPATKGLIRFYVELGAPPRLFPRPRQRETPHGHRHRAANRNGHRAARWRGHTPRNCDGLTGAGSQLDRFA